MKNGKGDRDRTANRDKYRAEIERIFSKAKKKKGAK